MEMVEVSSDPYELKLYQMFKSCDTEHCGLLDETALKRLCVLLELRDKGAVLIKGLLRDDTTKHCRISFIRFKEALLEFLGTELDQNPTNIINNAITETTTTTLDNKKARVLVIDENVQNIHSYGDSTPDTSSEREVSPRLIVGKKKYGRRSRPQKSTTKKDIDDGLSLSDTEQTDEGKLANNNDDDEEEVGGVQRSSSQTDIKSVNNRRCRPNSLSGSKLKRCSSLPAQRNLKTHFAKKQTQDKQQSSSIESLDAPIQLERLNKQSIIEIWENANIPNSRNVLLALGFDEDEISLAQLNKVLEEEVRISLDEEAHLILVRALVALQSSELNTLRVSCRQLHDENVKLRADNKAANHRVAMMAMEIDERHALLEDSSKKELRALEQKHAHIMRDLTTRMTNDREHWTQLVTKLEARIKTFEEQEIRLRTDVELLRKENAELESEQEKLQRQLTDLKQEQRNAANTTVELTNKNNADLEQEQQLLEMMKQVEMLQLENTEVRDKNDELMTELENLNLELMRFKSKQQKKLTTELEVEESAATATKRRGDSPSKTRLTELSPRLGKLRKCVDGTNDIETNSDTSGEWMALNSELTKTTAACTMEQLEEQISELEKQLEERNVSVERCKELETSLEQMQRAYEECEDYWQGKLAEERLLFEKERQIYEEEQQESDKKFTDLIEKVREYEDQFKKDGRLSPIEEKDTLEQQYTDLEAEAEELRENARKMFEEKSLEIESLQKEIADLRLRLGESVEILTGANELHSEAKAAAASVLIESPASSPISYLWQQSTIQEPAKHIEQFSYQDDVKKSIQRESSIPKLMKKR